MKPKSTLILDNEFIQYCELNKIDNVNKLAQETFNRGFSLLKYGETPSGSSTEKEKIIDKDNHVIRQYQERKMYECLINNQPRTSDWWNLVYGLKIL